MPLWKKLVCEFVGTFAFVFVGIGALVAAGFAGAEGGAGMQTVALAHGLVVAVMATAVGHVSGGHFNPAVTLGAILARAVRVPDAFAYVVSQAAGALAAAGLARVAFPTEVWQKVRLGTPRLADEGMRVTFGQGILLEAVLTFFLVWVFAAVVLDPKGAFARVAGLPVGLAYAMGIMAGAPFTGAAMNPVRVFGPALAGGYWDDHLVYWIGPLLGGAAAAAAYRYLVLSGREEQRPDEVAGGRTSTRERRRRRPASAPPLPSGRR